MKKGKKLIELIQQSIIGFVTSLLSKSVFADALLDKALEREVIEVRVESDVIVATNKDGTSTTYNVSKYIEPSTIKSTRLAYIIGHMQAERLLRESYARQFAYED